MFSYNIADIFTVQTNFMFSDLPSFYRVPKVDSVPDLSIIAGPFGQVKKKGNYYPFGKTLLLQNIENKAELYMNSTRYQLFKQLSVNEFYLIKAMIQIVLLKKRHTLIHAASLAKGNRGILLSALSNTGKTYTALTLAKYHDFDFLSDDMTIVSEKGLASSYPIPLSINKSYIEQFNLKLTPYERFSMNVKDNYLFKIPWIRLLFEPFDYDVSRLNLKIPKNPIPIKTLFLMERGDNSVERISKEVAFNKLWMNNRMNLMFYEIRELVAYSYIFDSLDLDELLSASKTILFSILENVDEILMIKRNDKRFELAILDSMYVQLLSMGADRSDV
jgi:hypothetical protein